MTGFKLKCIILLITMFVTLGNEESSAEIEEKLQTEGGVTVSRDQLSPHHNREHDLHLGLSMTVCVCVRHPNKMSILVIS